MKSNQPSFAGFIFMNVNKMCDCLIDNNPFLGIRLCVCVFLIECGNELNEGKVRRSICVISILYIESILLTFLTIR